MFIYILTILLYLCAGLMITKILPLARSVLVLLHFLRKRRSTFKIKNTIRIANCPHLAPQWLSRNEYFDMLLFASRYAERETSPLPPSLLSSLAPPYIPTSAYRREGICAQPTNEWSSIVPWRSWRKSVQVHSLLRETANTDAAAARKKHEKVQQGRHEERVKK